MRELYKMSYGHETDNTVIIFYKQKLSKHTDSILYKALIYAVNTSYDVSFFQDYLRF